MLVTSFLILGGVLILLQLVFAIIIHQRTFMKGWIKYSSSLIILITGTFFLPVSTAVVGALSFFLASSGIIMIVTTLVTIPIITLILDK
ncbi:hypothetical protein QA612_19705 [Evansella sp. AB-P1]|uniref:hypothetical protein n=1 Tax=Evansella sp. AB-P1 TaxID=3037653 RepID=UPI00241FF8DF|nr:hypothetical protein [Evansella sp. AB-P1]MDG5789686.1 hypothetical protein [Evansella sp. AB-P1]